MGALPWVGAGDVSSARDLSYMFAGAEAFNQDVSACTSSAVVCSDPTPRSVCLSSPAFLRCM